MKLNYLNPNRARAQRSGGGGGVGEANAVERQCGWRRHFAQGAVLEGGT